MTKQLFLAKSNHFTHIICSCLAFLSYIYNQKLNMNMKRQITFDTFVRAIIVIVCVVLAYLLIQRLSNVLIPFLVAWLIAYLLHPIVCFFQYKCKLKNRVLAIIVTLIAILGIIGLACWLVIPPVVEDMQRLGKIVVDYVTTNEDAQAVQVQVSDYISNNIDINQITQMLTFKDVSEILEKRVPQFFSIVTSSFNALIGFISSLIAIIYMFFILIDYEKMSSGFIHLVPKAQRAFVKGMILDVESGMNRYFRGQSLIALLVGVMFSIGFAIIGFPLAIPLGLFIGMLNLVPYLQVLGFIPTIILALLKAHDTGGNFWLILLSALAVFAIVQAIQDWVITPKVMGKVTGLNAAVILLSLSIWGSLLGFVGLIIALPLTTLIISYYKRFILHENDDIIKTEKEENNN